MAKLQLTGEQKARIIRSQHNDKFANPATLEHFLENTDAETALQKLSGWGFPVSDVKPEQLGHAPAVSAPLTLTESQKDALGHYFKYKMTTPARLEEMLNSPKDRKRALDVLTHYDAHDERTDPDTYQPVVKLDPYITEGYGMPAHVLQANKAALDAAFTLSQKPYKKNPYKEFVSLADRKKKAAEDLELALNNKKAEGRQFRVRAKEHYQEPTDYDKRASKIHELLKASSIAEKAKKLTGGFKNQLQEIEDAHGDYASDNLGKLLAPFQNGQMKHHGQTGNLVAGFLGRVAKNRDKEKALLLERMGERALDRAQNLASQKAGMNQNLIDIHHKEQMHKLGKLDKYKTYYDAEKNDFENDLNRSLNKHQDFTKSLQTKKNFQANEWQEREDDQKKKANEYRAGVQEIYQPIVHEKEYEEPPIQEHDLTKLGKVVAGFGGANMKKGGRLQRADGGALIQDAVENAQKNHLDPLQSLKNVSFYDQIKALEQKAQDRRHLKEGGAPSPITEGSRLAKEYALQDKVLEHADTISQPRKRSFLAAGLDGAIAALADDKTYGGFSKAYTAGRTATKAREDADDTRAEKASKLRHEVSKQMQSERKDQRHLDNQERQIKAQEAHYKSMETHHRAMETAANNRSNPLVQKEELDDFKRSNKEKHEYIESAREDYNASQKIAYRLDEIEKLATDVSLGGAGSFVIQNLPKGESIYKALGKSTTAKIEQYKTAIAGLVRDIETSTTGLHSKARQQLLQESKMSYDMPIDAVLPILNSMRHLNQKMAEQSVHGIDAISQKGMSPAEADISFHQNWHQKQKETEEHSEKEQKTSSHEETPQQYPSPPSHDPVKSRLAEIDAEIAKEEAKLHNRKKLGDLVQRYKHAEGEQVESQEAWHTMMTLPATRDLIHGLYGG